MEDKINQILEKSESQYIPSFKEIKDNTINQIDKIFFDYLNYKQNHINKENAIKLLENYHPISYKDISLGDFIKYFNNTYFYDVSIKGGGFVVKKNKKQILIKTQISFVTIKSNSFFFRKLTSEELAKIKVLDLLNDLEN